VSVVLIVSGVKQASAAGVADLIKAVLLSELRSMRAL
jgi:hypothetical protein